MEIIELLLDEESENAGIEAISIVSAPAIKESFIAMKEHEVKMAKVNEEEKLLMGAALIPEKPIYRQENEKEYYVYFSKDTVKKASQLFFMNGNQNNATLEHQKAIDGMSIVESWIVEDKTMDKSRVYGLDVPEGTWMVTMKVNNDEIWNDYVKENKVKGFSIEGYFADKASIKKEDMSEVDESEEKLKEIKNLFNKVSLETMVVNEDFAIVDDRLAYSTQEKAEQMAVNLGCSGFHTHDFKDKTWFMPCDSHNVDLYGECPKGFKSKNGKCVKNK